MSCGIGAQTAGGSGEAKNQRQRQTEENSGPLYAGLAGEIWSASGHLLHQRLRYLAWDEHKTRGFILRVEYSASTARKACNILFSSVKPVCR